jgi:hypothetical protein
VSAPEPNAPPAPLPDYLLRRAPAKVELTDDSGRALRMTRRFVHVRSGQHVRVRVVPQAPVPGEAPAVVKINPTDTLGVVVDPHTVPAGTVDAVLATYLPRWRGKVPVPKRGALFVSVTVPGCEAYRLTIPFAVWPSWTVFGSIGAVALAGPVIGNRFIELTKTLSPFSAVRELVTDGELLSTSAGFAALGAGLLKLSGWFAVWAGLLDE